MEYNVRMLSNDILKSKFEVSYLGYADDVVEFLEDEVHNILSADLDGTFDEQKRYPIQNILDVLCGIDNDVTLGHISMNTILFLYKNRGEYFYEIVDYIDMKIKEIDKDARSI